jgi:hypothetical protein
MQPTQVATDSIRENSLSRVKVSSNPARRVLNWCSSFSAFIASILIAKAVWTCRDRIADPDLWWHLRNAKSAIENHRLPLFDTYTFTVAGSPWLDHSWLSELFFYGAYRHFGLYGIFVLFAVCVGLLSLGIFAMCSQETDDPLAAGIVTIFCGLLAMAAYTPRPQLIGWLCFLGIYAILLRFRKGGSAPLWMIPVLFCLWINSHPGWPFGIVIFVVILMSGVIPRDIGPLAATPWSVTERRKLIFTFLVSCLALLVNPYGYKLLYYPFDLALREKLTVGLVQEWGSVNFNDPRGIYVFILLAAIFLMALFSSKRWRVDEVVLTLFVLYGGLAHIRLLLPAALVLAPILAPRLGRISSHVPGQERRILNSIFVAIVIGFIVWALPSRQMLNAQIRDYFPERAVTFLKSHSIEGKMFNWYEWGGYLEWNLPSVPVFIDGRTDFFEGHAVLGDYLRIAGLADSDTLLRDYEISYVLIPANGALSNVLSGSSHWKSVYQDEQSVIYQSTGQ